MTHYKVFASVMFFAIVGLVIGQRIVYARPALPHNGLIAFSGHVDEERNLDIYVIESDDSGLKRLTDHPDSDTEPMWSPDGTQIAFIRSHDGEGNLYIMDAEGKNLKQLTDFSGAWLGYFRWSPDGQWIALTSKRDSQIYFVSPTGDQIERLPHGGGAPRWLPDSKRLIFLCKGNTLCLFNRDTQDLQTIADNAGWYDISPDGSALAVASPHLNDDAFSIISLNDGQHRPLTSELEYYAFPVWSPDGKSIVFRAFEDNGGGLYVIDSDGQNLRQLTYGPHASPLWSPDGTQIVYFSREKDVIADLYVINPDGTHQRFLSGSVNPFGDYSWQPVPR